MKVFHAVMRDAYVLPEALEHAGCSCLLCGARAGIIEQNHSIDLSCPSMADLLAQALSAGDTGAVAIDAEQAGAGMGNVIATTGTPACAQRSAITCEMC